MITVNKKLVTLFGAQNEQQMPQAHAYKLKVGNFGLALLRSANHLLPCTELLHLHTSLPMIFASCVELGVGGFTVVLLQ